MEKWHNINNVAGFEVITHKHGYFGRIFDNNNNTVFIMGMPCDNIGFSYDYNTTYAITEKDYKKVIK